MLIVNLIIREDKITRVDFYAVYQNCGNGWKVKHKTNKKANLIRFFITLGFILLFLLIVIPSNQDGGGQRSEDPNEIYTQVAATLYAQASEPTEMPITEPTQASLSEIGTRSNPVPLGQPLDLIYHDIANFQITVLEVVHEQEAWNMISQANMFNEQPAEGMEYILAEIGITYQISTQQDYTLSIDSLHFDRVSNNQVLNSPSVVEPEPELNVKLFPGG